MAHEPAPAAVLCGVAVTGVTVLQLQSPGLLRGALCSCRVLALGQGCPGTSLLLLFSTEGKARVVLLADENDVSEHRTGVCLGDFPVRWSADLSSSCLLPDQLFSPSQT